MEGPMTVYVGSIRLFAGNFEPVGWMFCDGRLLPISEYDTLFNLIGTTYGGDGQSTFALPDLRSRVPVHQGSGAGTSTVLGEAGGVEAVTLSVAQLPAHTHPQLVSSTTASSRSAVGGIPAGAPSEAVWTTGVATEASGQTTSVGGSQPHDNMQPYLGINYIISLFGLYPSPT